MRYLLPTDGQTMRQTKNFGKGVLGSQPKDRSQDVHPPSWAMVCVTSSVTCIIFAHLHKVNSMTNKLYVVAQLMRGLL